MKYFTLKKLSDSTTVESRYNEVPKSTNFASLMRDFVIHEGNLIQNKVLCQNLDFVIAELSLLTTSL